MFLAHQRQAQGTEERNPAETEGAQAVLRPAITGVGRFAHHQLPADHQKGGAAFSGHGGPGEAASHHELIAMAVIGVTTGVLGSPGRHVDPVTQGQDAHRSLQKRRPAGSSIEQDPVPGGERQGQDQTRNASSTAQIHAPAGGDIFEGGDEDAGMVDVINHRARSEEALTAGHVQEPEQLLPGVRRTQIARVQSDGSDAITTWR